MSQTRQTQVNRFRRDAWLEINLDHLEFNLKKIHSEFNKPLLPVVKADAYGHGASVIAKTLDAYSFVYGYGVANIDEALNLRQASKNRIIVLGICPDWAIKQALELDIELAVASEDFIINLNELAKSLDLTAKIHIKLDTGMNRIGFKLSKAELDAMISRSEKLSNIHIESIFTHFADASDLNFCREQYEKFQELSAGLPYLKHPVSSPAARAIPGMEFDIMRCGIELYGLENPELKPLMSLYARISFIKEIESGDSVSYRRTWKANQATRIATLPLGYADGIPRSLSNKIQAQCKGHLVNQVGSITMDQVMFDIENHTDIKVGDLVELLGPNLPLQNWAEKANTISYEIATNLNLRLPKSYTR